ncbi:hypothetical protein [Rhodococcus sp. IEGM 1408]|uniref:GIY-YIG nuclease family protein n=1 Tax=Rhodococcus sp. IEGM 1408 TaxID=3082220 RepID=UPI002953B2C6|nr:hypothetical protein [Rhodococcus sp. IEGM 1408]MDV8003053.1 hypothetical protein [Rhodococcus sp. IEGM 1408]
MALASACSAFITDTRDELFVNPIIGIDSTTSLELSGASLILNIECGGESWSVKYDGSKWANGEKSDAGGPGDDKGIEALTVWMPLLPPALRTTGVPDGEMYDDQIAEALIGNAELISLFGTLVSGGWSVTLKHSEPSGHSALASISMKASAPVLDPERAPAVCAVWNLPLGIATFETVWTPSGSTNRPWGFDLARTNVSAADGTVHPIDPQVMSIVAIGAAPTWTLHPGVDQKYERHSTGGLMAATVLAPLTVEPHSEVNTEEIELRRKAVDEWAETHGFKALVKPAMPKQTAQVLAELGDGTAGYYLLEFENGDCYLGQSTSIADRLKGHRTLRKDIISIRPNPDPVASAMDNPLRHLLDQESLLIDSIQTAGLPARNKAQMTYLTGHRSLDDCLTDNDCTSADWLADPVAINAVSFNKNGNVLVAPEKSASGRADLEAWKTRTGPDTSVVLELIRTYMQRCLPLPLQTEYEYWTLSSPPVKPKWGTLSNLTIGWTEAFRINMEEDGSLSGWVQVNGIELLGDDMTDEAVIRFLRQHPGSSLDEAPYQAAGPYNLNVRASNLQVLAALLDDTAVTRAAATAALHLMRHSKAGAGRNAHNPVLVRAALGIG